MLSSSEKRMYSEVYGIIDCMGENYKNALPQKLYKYIHDNKDENYCPRYNLSEALMPQNLSKKATAFICFLHYKYWCETEEEKTKINKILKYNEEKNREKYNKNNIFEKNVIQQNSTENMKQQMQLVEYKENMFKKILRKLRGFFKF